MWIAPTVASQFSLAANLLVAHILSLALTLSDSVSVQTSGSSTTDAWSEAWIWWSWCCYRSAVKTVTLKTWLAKAFWFTVFISSALTIW